MSWLSRMRMRAARAIAPKPTQRALPAQTSRPVVEVKHAEDLACDPCGGNGVSQIAFDRPDSAKLFLVGVIGKGFG